ncbi:hypothetical protein DSECCO2_539980 [anaerobic digester metagenome]
MRLADISIMREVHGIIVSDNVDNAVFTGSVCSSVISTAGEIHIHIGQSLAIFASDHSLNMPHSARYDKE